MVNISSIGNISPIPKSPNQPTGVANENGANPVKTDFNDAVKGVGKYVSSVNELQQASNTSVMDLLAGKNTDINAVVSAIAKADMSFKLLVGVRNKLIEAYKQTMNMPL